MSASTNGRPKTPDRWPLPAPLMTLGAAALLIIVLYGAGWVLASVGSMISQVLMPVVIGVLFTALLMPVQVFFNHLLKLPRHVAAGITTLGFLTLVGGILYMSGAQLAEGFDSIRGVVINGLGEIESWLYNGPLHIQEGWIQQAIAEVRNWVQENTSSLSLGVVSATSSVGNVLIGTLIALIVAFFLLAEGDRLLSFILIFVGAKHRHKIREAIRRGWVTLGTWARVQVVVSAADALGISIGMLVLQLPFILPLAVLTFLVCFIPMVGAWVSGIVVVLVALVFEGPTAALIMILVVVVVQQAENNVLVPLLMGKAVNVHPLAIILGVATGTYLLGIAGALLTVPTLATLSTMVRYWHGNDPFPGLAAGRSALLDSPKDLLPSETATKRLPPLIGQATPDWLLNRFKKMRIGNRESVDSTEQNPPKKHPPTDG